MERELWRILYWMVLASDNCWAARGVGYSDGVVALTYLWAAAHDRPTVWACDERHWPRDEPLPFAAIPSQPTMSRRLRTAGVAGLLARVERAFLDAATAGGALMVFKMIDGKPLPVGGHSADPDARWGEAVRGLARGYKLYAIWAAASPVPLAWEVRPMDAAEKAVARRLIPRLADASPGGGYLAGDGIYDSNPLHDAAAAVGHQLVARRRYPGTGLGHRRHSPGRLRSIELLEGGGGGGGAFGAALRHARDGIERKFGNLTGFGGGLQPLPAWARRPWRVRLWVQAKILINAARIARNQQGRRAAA
jgi:hypothetical protein